MHQLAYLKAKFSNLNKQGTEEWLENRKYAFGGSEIASVLGNNPYESLNKLLDRKISKENVSDDARLWGHLFEPIAKKFIEKERNTEIHDFGSVPHPQYPICYSPDGILVEQDKLVLLEIKNPIWRAIHYVPNYYLDQVLSGMNIFPVAYCLFAQFMFRRCAIYTDSTSQTYDRFYHKESRTRAPPKSVIAYGYLYWNRDCEFIDLGSVDRIYDYVQNHKTPDEIIINEPFCPKRGMCLKWKLFDVNYSIIEPDHNYLKDREEKLWESYKILYDTLQKIKKVSSS